MNLNIVSIEKCIKRLWEALKFKKRLNLLNVPKLIDKTPSTPPSLGTN